MAAADHGSLRRLQNGKGGRGRGSRKAEKAWISAFSMVFSKCLIFQYVLSFVLQFLGLDAFFFRMFSASLIFSSLGHFAASDSFPECHAAAFPPLPGPANPGLLPSRAECHFISLARWRGIVKRKDRPPAADNGAQCRGRIPIHFLKRIVFSHVLICYNTGLAIPGSTR